MTPGNGNGGWTAAAVVLVVWMEPRELWDWLGGMYGQFRHRVG